jgi:hypothetical protein
VAGRAFCGRTGSSHLRAVIMARRFEQSYSSQEHEFEWRPVERSRALIKGYPMSATLVAWAVGFGAGVVVAGMLADSFGREERTTERLTRQMMAAMSRILPESVLRAVNS